MKLPVCLGLYPVRSWKILKNRGCASLWAVVTLIVLTVKKFLLIPSLTISCFNFGLLLLILLLWTVMKCDHCLLSGLPCRHWKVIGWSRPNKPRSAFPHSVGAPTLQQPCQLLLKLLQLIDVFMYLKAQN